MTKLVFIALVLALTLPAAANRTEKLKKIITEREVQKEIKREIAREKEAQKSKKKPTSQ